MYTATSTYTWSTSSLLYLHIEYSSYILLPAYSVYTVANACIYVLTLQYAHAYMVKPLCSSMMLSVY